MRYFACILLPYLLIPFTFSSGLAQESLSSEENISLKINNTQISIHYHPQNVEGREIWGKLVPYEKIWESGVQIATSILFSKPVSINGKLIPSGKYSLFTIPTEQNWTIIINTNSMQHQDDRYDPGLDIIRLQVTPERAAQPQEKLRYFINKQSAKKALISFAWETVKFSFPVEVLNE